MELIETHAHLDDKWFNADRDAVIQRAIQAGVKAMVTIGTNTHSSRAAVDLATQYEAVYAAVGVHPHSAKSVNDAVLDELCELGTHPQVVAIGEIGLDYYRDLSPRDVQRRVFVDQLELAAQVRKPVVVHIRDQKGTSGAYDDALTILSSWLSTHAAACPSPPGVLHFYSGDWRTASLALDMGFYLGVDAPITYPNADELRSVVARLPLDRLVLETDCPYLTYQDKRRKRNEPSYLVHTAKELAEIQQVSAKKVAAVTTANAARLFGLPQ